MRPHVTVLPLTKQVIKIVEQMAHDEGVRDLRTYHWKNGEVILDGDLSAGVDPDELWDDIYIPNENEYKRSDENLRNERISQEEIDDLLEDAEEFLNNNDDDDEIDNNPEESQENRSVASVFERLERRHEQEESGQNPNPNEDDEEEDEDLDQKIREIEGEIENINHELDELNDEENEEEKHEENNDLIAQIEDQIRECEDQVDDVRNYVENMDSNAKGSNETDDESDDLSHEMDENQNFDGDKTASEKAPSPRKETRSGRAYVQNGIKMRPTDRNGRDRPRYNQPYLKRKKPKDNSLKNRSAMRRKERLKRLKRRLHIMLLTMEKSRMKRRAKFESKYNLCFHQKGKQSKVEYAKEKALLIGSFMQQIKDKVENKGVNEVLRPRLGTTI